MKRYLLLPALMLCFLLAACSSASGQSGDPAASASAVSEPEQASSESSKASSAAATSFTATAGDSALSSGSASEDLTAPTEEAEQNASPVLLYQGHASLRIETADGHIIYIDPFAGEGYDKPADLILVTHDHYDHTDTGKIASQNGDCQTFTFREALTDGTYHTLQTAYVTVEAVEAGYNANHDVRSCVGFLLTFENGTCLYVSGDTSATPQMEELSLREIDYAFFCCDGVYNMNPEEASACAETVGARHSIPYHTSAADKELFDPETANAFQADHVLILQPGDTLPLDRSRP